MSDKELTELLNVEFTNPVFSTVDGRITVTEEFSLAFLGQGAVDIADDGHRTIAWESARGMVGIIFGALYGENYISHRLQSTSHELSDELGAQIIPSLRLTGTLTRYTLTQDRVYFPPPG